MEYPSTSSCDREQVQGLISTPIVQDFGVFSGLLTPPASKEEIRPQPSSTESPFGPKFAFCIRPRATKDGQHGWTRSCFPTDEGDVNRTPRNATALTSDSLSSLYPISGVHRTIKSSTKQRILSASYPLLLAGSAKSRSLSGKRLPGSRLPVLGTLPCVSTPFQYHAPPGPGVELQSPDTGSPDDDMASSGEDGPIQTQPTLDALEHSESEAESITPKLYGRPYSPPNKEPVATDFYEHYTDQRTDHESLHAEYGRLEQLCPGLQITNPQGPTFFTGEAPDQINSLYVALEEDVSRPLEEEFMGLYEGGHSGHEIPYVRDPMRSDPFDTDYDCHMPLGPLTFSPDESFDIHHLEFYDGRGLPPTQAFDEDLLALFYGRDLEEDASELRWDSIRDDHAMGLDLPDVPPKSQ